MNATGRKRVKRVLTVWFYAHCVGFAMLLGPLLGEAAAVLIADATSPIAGVQLAAPDMHRERESLDVMERTFRQHDSTKRRVKRVTMPLGILVIGFVFTRLLLWRSIVAVDDTTVTVTGLFKSRTRNRTEVVAAFPSTYYWLGWLPMRLQVLRFRSGWSSVTRHLFVANAETLAARMSEALPLAQGK